jgi:DNA-binding transcriptional LysR family regulator
MLWDFNDLQFLAAVVQYCGFSARTRALGLPKSRVSCWVAILEERLGLRLLDRTTRGINLTAVGQQIFEHARTAVIEERTSDDVTAELLWTANASNGRGPATAIDTLECLRRGPPAVSCD